MLFITTSFEAVQVLKDQANIKLAVFSQVIERVISGNLYSEKYERSIK